MATAQRAIFITTGLGRGGAENSLLQLLRAIPRDEFALELVSLKDGGDYIDELRSLDIPLTSLHLQRLLNWPGGLFALWRLLTTKQPNLLVCWMYHANLVGGVIGWLTGVKRIFFNIRHSTISVESLRFTTRLVVRLGAALAVRVSEAVIFNSYRAAGVHVAERYPLRLARVIHNGFDINEYRPSTVDRRRVRSELGFTEQDFVVGILGRYDRVKNHAGFFAALKIVMQRASNVKVCAAGTNVDNQNAEIVAQLAALGIKDRVQLLGKRDDVAALLNAFDLLVVSSISESFPRVLGEALASGVPCISTDVGEARSIIGDCGVVLSSIDELPAAIEQHMQLAEPERQQLRVRGRERMANLFSDERTVQGFVQLMRAV